MIFFPYRVDMELRRLPFLTLAVCLLCGYVFLQQLSSYQDYQKSIEGFCNSTADRSTLIVLRNIVFRDYGKPCAEVYLAIRESENPDDAMVTMVTEAKPMNIFKTREAEVAYMLDILKTGYERFERAVPLNLTDELQYNPLELKIKQMVTAVFSHGSWTHLIFNLVFFYAFAASVEIIVGSLSFLFIILAMSVSTGLAYSYSVVGTPEAALPTVGLSGIVMGMMALLAVMVPKVKIRCFFWFLFFVRFFSLPALLLAAWYVGGDLYSLSTDDGSAGINFVAHISGAASGAVIGLIYWLLKSDYLRDLNDIR